MGNHNIQIMDPKGNKKLHFPEDTSFKECRKWLVEFGPAPIGWHYNIVNHNKKPRKYPAYIRLLGFDLKGKLIDERKARVEMNDGKWYTVRKAKRDARALGANVFVKQKVWQDGTMGHEHR